MDAGVEEGELAQAMLERRVVVFDHLEGFGRGEERHLGTAPALCLADHLERRYGIAMGELDQVLLVLAPDPQLQLARQRVDDGDANAVQTAGNLVGVLVELTAGMQLGHDDLGCRHAFTLVDVDRNAAAVIAHRDGIVGVEHHLDAARIAGECFVDRIVDDLVDHVV